MSTRAELRTALRTRLEDTTVAPLWNDPALDDALTGAIRTYGARFPRESVTTVVVAAGETRVPVAMTIDPARIVRLLDGDEETVPRMRGALEGAFAAVSSAQSWRWWDGVIILARPANAGTWRIEYLAPRETPTDDVTAVDLLPGDEAIVLALAEAAALRRRVTEDAKRGLRADGVVAAAEAAHAVSASLIAGRHRRARGDWM